MLSEKNLHHYQVADAQMIVEKSHCGLLLEMGLGKTVTTLTAINRLMYEEVEISKVLVVAPKRVAESVWPDEVKQWAHLCHLRVAVATGTPAKRARALEADVDIVCLSRDNVKWMVDLYGAKPVPFDMLVVDESSSFKNPSSQRFKALRKILPRFDRVVALTGTFAPNGLIDIWAQIFLLDQGERLGKYVTHYRAQYFRPASMNGHIVYSYALRPGADELIYGKIRDITQSRKASEYIDLPSRTDNVVKVDMGAKAKKLYDELEKEMVLELAGEFGDAEIPAVNAAALTNKLLQLAGGALYDEDRKVHEVHKAKLDVLRDIVEEANGNPVLIAWNFKHEEDRIHEALKAYKPVKLEGNETIEAWNKGKVRVLTMHPASGGHGLNLQKGGNTIVWYSPTWSLELDQQLNARLHRQGQRNAVTIHKLIATGTVDEQVIKAQRNKTRTQDAINEAVKAKVKKYLEIND